MFHVKNNNFYYRCEGAMFYPSQVLTKGVRWNKMSLKDVWPRCILEKYSCFWKSLKSPWLSVYKIIQSSLCFVSINIFALHFLVLLCILTGQARFIDISLFIKIQAVFLEIWGMLLNSKQGSCVILKPTPSIPSLFMLKTKKGWKEHLQ